MDTNFDRDRDLDSEVTPSTGTVRLKDFPENKYGSKGGGCTRSFLRRRTSDPTPPPLSLLHVRGSTTRIMRTKLPRPSCNPSLVTQERVCVLKLTGCGKVWSTGVWTFKTSDTESRNDEGFFLIYTECSGRV